MRKFIYTCVITLGAMLISSCIDTPKIESIRFIDDRTIEYENEFSLGVGDYGYSGYDVKLLSLDPNNGAYVKRNVHTSTIGISLFRHERTRVHVCFCERGITGKSCRSVRST